MLSKITMAIKLPFWRIEVSYSPSLSTEEINLIEHDLCTFDFTFTNREVRCTHRMHSFDFKDEKGNLIKAGVVYVYTPQDTMLSVFDIPVETRFKDVCIIIDEQLKQLMN